MTREFFSPLKLRVPFLITLLLILLILGSGLVLTIFYPNDTVCFSGLCVSKPPIPGSPLGELNSFFSNLLKVSGRPARWYCGSWTGFEGWTFVIADIITFLSYFGIPSYLIFVLQRRKSKYIPFRVLLWLFSFFILFCGITHLLDAIIFWYPVYNLLILVKVFTAAISFSTLVAAVIESGRLLSLKGPEELKRLVEVRTQELNEVNKQLALEIETRKKYELELKNQLDLNKQMFVETHHRIKNNLQVILNMLDLRLRSLPPETSRSIKPVAMRILSISKLHDKLLQSDVGEKVNIKHFVYEIINSLSSVIDDDLDVNTRIDINEKITFLPDNALNFGLVISEIYMNSAKHAFKIGRENHFFIQISEDGGLIEIGDNGSGFDIRSINQGSFGMMLIDTFVNAMNGELEILSDEQGTRFIIKEKV